MTTTSLHLTNRFTVKHFVAQVNVEGADPVRMTDYAGAETGMVAPTMLILEWESTDGGRYELCLVRLCCGVKMTEYDPMRGRTAWNMPKWIQDAAHEHRPAAHPEKRNR